MIGVDNDEVAVAEIGDGRLVLHIARRVGDHLQLALAINRVAGCIVFAEVDVLIAAGAGQVVVGVVETDDEATCGKPGDAGLLLITGSSLVNQEFAADLEAGRIVALAVDTVVATAGILVVGTPDDDKAAVGQRGDARLVLIAGGRGVDQEGVAQHTSATDGATVDAVDAAVVATKVLPDDDQTTIGAGRDGRGVLSAGLRCGRGTGHGGDPGFGQRLIAGVVEALEVDIRAACPHHGEAVGVAGNRIELLGAAGRRIDHEVGALRHVATVVALGNNAPAGAVKATAVLPGDDKAAVAQSGDVRVFLFAGQCGVDPRFAADGGAVGGKVLEVDAVGIERVLTVGLPDNDVAAVVEDGDFRFFLSPGGVGVDLFFTMGQRLAVEFRRDVDGDGRGSRAAAVAVGNAQTDGARGVRALRGAAVGEVLN